MGRAGLKLEALDNLIVELGSMITDLRKGLYTCSECGNVSETNPCNICSDPMRDRKLICIVDDIESIYTLENAGVYNGLYHILGGRDIPLKGKELTVCRLESRREIR